MTHSNSRHFAWLAVLVVVFGVALVRAEPVFATEDVDKDRTEEACEAGDSLECVCSIVESGFCDK